MLNARCDIIYGKGVDEAAAGGVDALRVAEATCDNTADKGDNVETSRVYSR
jgi:hypothetical protein